MERITFHRWLASWIDSSRRRRRSWCPRWPCLRRWCLGALIIVIAGGNPLAAYLGLFQGAFGSARALSETTVWATPYIFAGLAVALAFKGGLFNIGAEGQLAFGAVASAWVGYKLPELLGVNLPALLHLPLAVGAGMLAGGVWGAIPGWLKARTGAHEVINTIMMNYIALNLTSFLLNGVMKDPNPQQRRRSHPADCAERSVSYHFCRVSSALGICSLACGGGPRLVDAGKDDLGIRDPDHRGPTPTRRAMPA